MATLLPEGIQALLAGLGVESPIPTIEGTDVQNNPIDIYLSYLADTLVRLTECSPQVAFDSIQWPNDLGDLVVVLPRLRLQAKNPKTLSTELKQKVRCHCYFFPCGMTPFTDLMCATKTVSRLSPPRPSSG